ncbi:hypothetical protein EG850_00890 [Gulosibacter macacae]|uniref:Uncharacterized protein n=1 Tax=Gulosibacter macacae TaxID=2488791 RepID=A0A3P3W7T5_9MICO|nr:hypothetical protein [Gulosibacter macacae]RRJ88733.1 hypothetical protein EG850_00890 [Gulosibacter macacae]
MRLHDLAGLLRLSPSAEVPGHTDAADAPLRVAVECAGAVLEWSREAASGTLPMLTLLDLDDAHWLWQLIGDSAHARLLETAAHRAGLPAGGAELDIELNDELLLRLHRFAHGLWLRSWWPASTLDGIPVLDAALLDAELAALADELDDVLLDGGDDQTSLLLARSSPIEYARLAHSSEPEIARFAASALDALGYSLEEFSPAEVAERADYALAAGARTTPNEGMIAGFAEPNWQAVPAGLIDASERAVGWTLDIGGDVQLQVQAQLLPGGERLVAGIPVTVRGGGNDLGRGLLDAQGSAALHLDLSAAEAWLLTAEDLRVRLGYGAATEPPQLRDRIRTLAATRMRAEDALTLAAEREVAARDY